ncbi:MAG: A/G-specific adenine glycosylase [Verrucomicrobiales bacterium]|nr:A/G-specific adenine glycosylase [Verrucomicrobiales bacterium]
MIVVSDWQKALIRWFRRHGKSYPWRETKDPYKILVSELMLQQTRIRTVLDKRFYENWLEKFPDIETLARADESEVLKAWEGLGYYNRARNLQKAAREIVEKHHGKFPEKHEQVLNLPGVGPYTAGAVCSFAYDMPLPIVDGNVVRVLSRVLQYKKPVDTSAGRKTLWQEAERLTCQSSPADYNSAIMELGQQICLKGTPKCGQCPVSSFCGSKDSPDAAALPQKSKPVPVTRKTEEVALLLCEGRVLLTTETGSRRKGLLRLPLLEEIDANDLELIGQITYSITRYQVEMRIFGNPYYKKFQKRTHFATGEWFDLTEELPALGAPYLKAIEQFTESKSGNL